MPDSSTKVVIPENVEMALVGGSCEAFWTVVHGELLTADRDVSFVSQSILIDGEKAQLEVGQVGAPYTDDFVLSLNGTQSDEIIVGAGQKFLVARSGGQIHLHGRVKTSWTRLKKILSADPLVVTFTEDPVWEINDEIIVAGTFLQSAGAGGGGYPPDCVQSVADQSEETTIIGKAVNPSGDTTYTLRDPFQFTHASGSGSRTYVNSAPMQPPMHPVLSWDVEQRAEVGLLSRNITIQGDLDSQSNDFGGLIMVTRFVGTVRQSGLFASHVEFHRLGQKQIIWSISNSLAHDAGQGYRAILRQL